VNGIVGQAGGGSLHSDSRGTVTAVCATHAVLDFGGRLGPTGIDKRAVVGPVTVGPLGIDGDTIIDGRFHGGLDQAVYAYGDSDADVWVAELARDLTPGAFGENLRIGGMAVSDAVIGERWQLGEPGLGPLLEVTSPRTPCAKFQRHTGQAHWVKRFTQVGLTGAYLRVIEPGRVSAGDVVEVVSRPEHGVTVRRWFTGRDPADAAALLAAHEAGEIRLQEAFRPEIAKALARAG